MAGALGKFVVIEGGDGAGKDTQIELLKTKFGDHFLFSREPGGTEIGGKIREILQHGDNVMDETELLLFLASRAQLVREVVLPQLRAGKHVLLNRFDPSTLAYQIHGRQKHHLKDLFMSTRDFVRGEAVPDLLIYLDIPPEIGAQRTQKRGEKTTRLEKEALDFHRRVREGYLEALTHYPHALLIDANRDIDAVHADIVAAIEALR